MSSDVGESVQVVGVTRERKFVLDEAALRRVLHERLRALPVLVLSVAGAFRSGKSFILDYFLRYLNASESSRSNGEWLGQDDEPLRGFSWRSGVERNTIGIHLWSTPHVLTTPSGEKVVVLLMDTQGTFDNESTMRECTTIFALSTLISSVQIYNICQNLKEDDLQHLELFTGYAKLVLDEVGKPFQNLTFLIRDWNFPDDYAYGYQGGKLLLSKKLQVNKEQPAELQDVRQHIHSCFQEIDCFLMQHPGFDACKKTFNGKLNELRQEFKENLLELVPALFTSNLQPKMSSGRRVTVGELASYFRVYISIFNGDDLPSPSTILKATAKAGLMVAVEAARAQYLSSMGGAGEGGAGRALPPAALRALHAAAVAAATQLLSSSKTLADRCEVDLALAQLTEELKSQIGQVELVNNMKIKKATDEALKTYDQEMLNGGNELDICEDPKKLERMHQSAVETACAIFDQRRTLLEGYEDKDKPNLIRDLKERYGQLMSFNELNNTKASSETAEHFILAMNNECNGGNPCMSRARLQRVFDRLRQEAIDSLATKRKWTSKDADKYVENLCKIVDDHFGKLNKLNQINNQSAHISTVSFYKENMNNVFGPMNKCLCTLEFTQQEKRVRAESITFYEAKRTLDCPDEENDEIKDIVLLEIDAHCNILKSKNEKINIAAVDGAICIYDKLKDARKGVSIDDTLLMKEIVQSLYKCTFEAKELVNIYNEVHATEGTDSKVDTTEEEKPKQKMIEYGDKARQHSAPAPSENTPEEDNELEAHAQAVKEKNDNMNNAAINGAVAEYQRAKGVISGTESVAAAVPLVNAAAQTAHHGMTPPVATPTPPTAGQTAIRMMPSIVSLGLTTVQAGVYIAEMVTRNIRQNINAKDAAIGYFRDCRLNRFVGPEDEDEHYRNLLSKLV